MYFMYSRYESTIGYFFGVYFFAFVCLFFTFGCVGWALVTALRLFISVCWLLLVVACELQARELSS